MRIVIFLLCIGSILAIANANDRLERAIKSKPQVNKKAEIVEGSGAPLKALSSNVPTDLEVFGSGKGYSSDDEDSEIQGSGGPPSSIVEGSGLPDRRPTVTTTTTSAPSITGTRSTTTTHAVFNPVDKLPDPVVHVTENDKDADIVSVIREQPKETTTTTESVPKTTPRRIKPAVPDEHPDGSPFSTFPKTGLIAALIGGAVIGLITAVLLVMFIVYRMRKKDEGSYALDEPKPRPYSNYPYSKANTKEFYA